MDKLEQPGGPWQTAVVSQSMRASYNGRSNIGWGCIDTQNQQISGAVNFWAYKLRKDPSVQQDYYAVYGQMSHGVMHSEGSYNPETNWVSVGYFATHMSLVLEISGDGDKSEYSCWDCGPTSTVGENSTSFSIGANLNLQVGDITTVGGGVDASFGCSFSAPDVLISGAKGDHSARWDVNLPGVGFKSPGVPANPFAPSYGGYEWYFGAIFMTPPNVIPNLLVHPRIEWEFDYTRGIINHQITWEDTKTIALNVPTTG